MSLTDEMDALSTEFDERNEFFEALSQIKLISSTAFKILERFEYIKNKGSFATIPDNIKAVILRWEAAFKICKQSLTDDEEIVELYGWKK